ncbi:Hpt domain-containing protein [Vibrio tapetis]|uniref:HPt domain-containing protein n=1 Tax=Vibrio tapetis subsp. tapetis TaxID=1671868 RepID=A0A2N8Z9A9_9VIBR|nr:Hpt domain-containing protein [Vibrio tapetis]SON48504.1 protein of unknown function [Vibrio tapetis subsp. tapetis]
MTNHLTNAINRNDELASPLESVSGLNTSDAMARFGNNSNIYHDLLSQWIESERDFNVRITSAMLQHDYQSVAMYLHTLKGTSANLGAMSISDKARELEFLLKANPRGERITEKLGQLSSDLSFFFEQLNGIIQTEEQKINGSSQKSTSGISHWAEGHFGAQTDDPTQVRRVLNELLHFLDNYDTCAIEYVERHYTELDYALGGEQFEFCYKRIHQCDFEAAGKTLRQLWPELE